MPQYIEPLFRPPSEARSLIFQITVGCSQNRCSFCGMYKGKLFKIRPVREILAEIAEIPIQYRSRVERVFLADGDALVFPFEGLVTILDALAAAFPSLRRVAAYASPHSITTKNPDSLAHLREKRLNILYFGLESGDDQTLFMINKGYDSIQMAELALMARGAGIKLSVTSILGLAGKERSLEHARGTAEWINKVNPEYFSLLTLFYRHNDDFVRTLKQCSRREILSELVETVKNLCPTRTILRSNHVSNFINLAGSYPKDRDRLIADAEKALMRASEYGDYFDQIPVYEEHYY